MGVSDKTPDNGLIIQCALKLDAKNLFLPEPIELTGSGIREWKSSLLDFCKFMTALFSVDVNTNRHNVMRQLRQHVINMVCIKQGSSEEN